MYGLSNRGFTWELRSELFPEFTSLLNKRLQLPLLVGSPALASLRQQPAVATVAHLFSSVGHMLRNVFPGYALGADQLQKLLILLS